MSPELPDPADAPDLLIIAGEHSGDEHAARMIAAALRERPGLKVYALGGPRLREAGAELLFDLTDHSVVGLFEVLKNYSFFKKLFDATTDWVARHRPRAICFVDYPGFNLRLAQALHRQGLSRKGGGPIRLLYYIGPQIWAWKHKRRFRMAALLDALAVIFPFEVACYQDTRLPVTFVGHPFAQDGATLPLSYAAQGPILLLPGSRLTPVRRILPLMLRGLETFLKNNKNHESLIIYPSDAIHRTCQQILAQHPVLSDRVRLIPQSKSPQPAAAVLTSSGTMSLQVALAGVPGAIVYRAHPLTYMIGRRVVKIPWLGIANILLQRAAWPEYIQGAAQPQALAAELQTCLPDTDGTPPPRATQAHDDAEALRTALGGSTGLSASDWLLNQIDSQRPPES